MVHLNALTGAVIPAAGAPAYFKKHKAKDVFSLKDANRSLVLVAEERWVRFSYSSSHSLKGLQI